MTEAGQDSSTDAPGPAIRVVALGLLWHRDRLLVAPVLDRENHLVGLRPPGGAVECGETAAEAVIREFDEELGVVVRATGAPLCVENLFQMDGKAGHEIVLVFDLALGPGALAFLNCEDLVLRESGGRVLPAFWRDAGALIDGRAEPLLPSGLATALRLRAAASPAH